ncbi:ran GTPase-activating protein 1-like [Chenopodium quinoa]|uniref:ran GTPase-activating protein 1-like n=1 Tax=Chenopodium quinoa TaxID=63459 RepID=UPI000B791CF6|nr:ran GTPase-activating protein 1-like [Chenopodium quinoa]XP_021725347.1 ran GTPase-activating protein 1-like [Chenopodium quinoa]
MTDEEIYAKVKPIGKRGRHRSNGVSPYITSLYETFSEGEKLRKEADEAKNEAIEAKKEAKEANVKNKALTKKMGGLQKEMEVMKGFIGNILNHLGYDLCEINMDEVNEGEDEDEGVDEDEDEEMQADQEE